MQLVGRKYTQSNSGYRYGFNGKENDKDITEGGQDYGMRIYDTRLGKFLSVDPLSREYPELTPYQFSGNSPIVFTDRDGEEQMFKMPDGSTYVHPPSDHLRLPIPQSVIQNGTPIYQGASNGSLLKLLTFTDVNDATVIATSITRKKPINIDGTEASGADKGFAYVGAIVPVVSGSALKHGVKGIIRGSKWGINALRYGSKVADAIKGGSTALRSALENAGVSLLGKEAHHIIPTQLLTENKVVQDAVNDGFDFNGAVNGIGLSKVADGGVHANHPNYTAQITEYLDSWAASNKGYKPEDARKALENYAGKLKKQIQKESVEGGKKVNALKLGGD